MADLELDAIGSFNLLIGANEVGKTSVLEAILLLSGLNRFQLPVTIQNARGLDRVSFDTMEALFCNLDTGSPIELSGSLRESSETFRLEISTGEYERSLAGQPVRSRIGRRTGGDGLTSLDLSRPISTRDSSLAVSKTIQCKAEIADSNDEVRKSAYGELSFSSNGGVHYKTRERDSKLVSIPAKFINSRLSPSGSAIHHVVINKMEPLLLDILRQMNPRIKRIVAGNQEVYVDIGLSRLMPLNTLGSGLIRLANVCAMALSNKAQILLIDEIEKGLHYTGIENYLKAVLTLTGRQNIQVFATTHSLGILKGLQSLLNRDGFARYGPDVNCFKLAKDKYSKVIAYRYDHEQFDHCIRHGIEVR